MRIAKISAGKPKKSVEQKKKKKPKNIKVWKGRGEPKKKSRKKT